MHAAGKPGIEVRLTAQQAPATVPGLRLEHRLIQFSISK